MKTKTIKKVLSKKIDAWIDSITDEKVRNACRKDFIVTGGSIASMLLKEKVNDFDIYFKSIDTVKLVSDYYVNQINKVYRNTISDSIIEVVDSKEIPSKDYANKQDATKWSMFSDGLKRWDEHRVKIFIPHIGFWRKSDPRNCKESEPPKEETFQPIYLTENAITLSDDIQLVIRFFGDAEKIHENYDFAHATSYFHNKDGKRELVLRSSAMEALLTKELIYIGSKYPLTSIIRTKKFLGRGFTISAGTYLKILWQVAELDLKDPIVLQEQLIGVDIAYFSLLLEALTNIAPEKMTYNYVSEIIDRVFNEYEEEEEPKSKDNDDLLF